MPDSLFNVRFRFDRLHMRTWHRAVSTIDIDFLWPSSSSIVPQEKVRNFVVLLALTVVAGAMVPSERHPMAR